MRACRSLMACECDDMRYSRARRLETNKTTPKEAVSRMKEVAPISVKSPVLGK